MKTLRVLAIAVLVLLSAVPALAETTTYQVDPVHSSITFSINHMGVTCVWGRFNQVEGTLVLDPKNDANNSAQVTVDAASVDTHVEKRDEHLRSADFFNVEKFPKITFVSRSLKKTGPATGDLTGDLTLLGVAKCITVPVTMTGEGDDPHGGYRAGFTTEFTIKRSDFGMTSFLPKALGDEVQMKLCVEGLRPKGQK